VWNYRLQERKSNFEASFSSFNAVNLIVVSYGLYKVVPDCQGAHVLWFVSRRYQSCALELQLRVRLVSCVVKRFRIHRFLSELYMKSVSSKHSVASRLSCE
jgi:hypothetical protein